MTRTIGFKFRVLSIPQNYVIYQLDEEMQTTSESQTISYVNNFFVQWIKNYEILNSSLSERDSKKYRQIIQTVSIKYSLKPKYIRFQNFQLTPKIESGSLLWWSHTQHFLNFSNKN